MVNLLGAVQEIEAHYFYESIYFKVLMNNKILGFYKLNQDFKRKITFSFFNWFAF